MAGVTLGEVMTLPSSELSVGQLLATGVRGDSAGDRGSPQPRGGHGHNAILSHWGQPGQSILLPAETTLSSPLLSCPGLVVLFPDFRLEPCVTMFMFPVFIAGKLGLSHPQHVYTKLPCPCETHD